MAGLSASFHLKKDHLIIERENSIGGLCGTKEIKGFYFDYTGHLIHFKSDYCLNLIKSRMGNNLLYLKRKAFIFMDNKYIEYPFQVNFTKLSPEIVKECFADYIYTYYNNADQISNNFLEWILNNFGEGMTKYFYIPYNEKLWKFPLNEMNYDRIEKYIPKISLEELLDNFLGIVRKDYGYNINFYYPKSGGIKSLAYSLLRDESLLNLNLEVIRIKSHENELILRNTNNSKETILQYNKLISTIPILKLLNLIEDVPSGIKKDLKALQYISLLCINYALKNRIKTDKHWIYFPEKEFPFHRIGFPPNFSPNMVPRSRSSLYAEISYNPKEEIDIPSISKEILNSLFGLDLINKRDKILFEYPLQIPYAYVIYKKNTNYNSIFTKINEFLKSFNIYSIGRFGSWDYLNMEDVILEGKMTAESLNVL